MKFAKFIFGAIMVIAALSVVGRIFLFDLGQTQSYGMIPNLVPGDVFLFRTVGLLGVGDIAVCENPENPGELVVSRIIGLPEDEIAFKKNHLILNGKMLHHSTTEPILYENNTSGETMTYAASIVQEKSGGSVYKLALMDISKGQKFRKTVVPNDHFFVVGDNRNMTHDSRNFGFMPIENCMGEILFVLWPGQDSGDIKQTSRILSWIH